MTDSYTLGNHEENATGPEEWQRQTPNARRPPPPPSQPVRTSAPCPMTFYMREAISLSALAFPHVDKSALRIQFAREDGSREPTRIFALLLSVDSSSIDVRFRGHNVALLPPAPPLRVTRSRGSLSSRVNGTTHETRTEDSDGGGLNRSLDGHDGEDPSENLDRSSNSHSNNGMTDDTRGNSNSQRAEATNEMPDEMANEASHRSPNQSIAERSSNSDLTAANPFQQKIFALQSLWNCLDAHLVAQRVAEPDTDDSTWGDYASDMMDEDEDDSMVVVDANDIAQTTREAVEHVEGLERVHEIPTGLDDESAGRARL